MPALLLEHALITVEEAVAFLKLGATAADEDLAIDLTNRATDYCEWWCNRPLAVRDFVAVRVAAQCEPRLRVRAWPIDVTEPLTISLDGVAQTIWKTEADGDPATFDVLVLGDVPGAPPTFFWRAAGWHGSSRSPSPILMTYTGGLNPVPGELREAAYLVLANIYNAQERKLSDVQAFGAGPVSPSVTYRADLIPMKAKQILDSYRLMSA